MLKCTVTVSSNETEIQTKSELRSREYSAKIINDPERGQAVIADCGVSQASQWKHFSVFPVILRRFSAWSKHTSKTKKKNELISGRVEHNHNKQVGLFPLKHTWELQPSNKNIQALKSALHRFGVHNPWRANRGWKTRQLLALCRCYRCSRPREFSDRKTGVPTPAEQTARAAYSSLGVSVREADMCEDLTVSISAYQHYWWHTDMTQEHRQTHFTCRTAVI